MMQESLTNNPLLAGIAITLIHFLWQGVLVALVLKMLLSLISYQKSQLRYALASAAMLANLALPLITFLLVYDVEYRQATSLVQALPLLDQSFYLEHRQANVWYSEWLEYLPAISIVWLSIVTLLSVKLLVELYNVNKLPLRGTLPASSALQSRFNILATKIGLTKKVRLLLSNKTDVPMAIGWLKPVVLIPFSMVSGLTPQQLDMLLLHELAHIRRHDYLVNFLQTLVETLLFFQPTVRWVSKQMRNEREFCSDDIAVQHSGNALAYAHTLADTASLCQKHRHRAIPSMAMAASGGDLKQRVIRLLESQHHCTQTTDSGKWLASITILLVILFVFSKYSLTLPVIDIQSGSISLNNSPLELSKNSHAYNPLSLEKLNTNSSLANQLIAINSANKENTDILPKQPITDNNPTLVQVAQESSSKLASTPVLTSESNNTIFYDELPIVSQASIDLKTEQAKSTLASAPQKQKKSTAVVAKSISELAFERTDSKSKSTTLANPYSQQVASLLDEPTAMTSPFDVEHKAQLNDINTNPSTTPIYHDIGNRNSTTFTNSIPSITKPVSIKAPEFSHAKLLTSIEPKYPSSAKRKGIELEVMVEFSIDKNGFVKNIQFESKSKVSYFRNAIRNAMGKWRFLPAEKNGTAVESQMSKIFSFSLLK